MSKIIQDVNVGENLRRLRKSRNLTQQGVCTRMAIAGRPMIQSTLAQIETGQRNIFASDLIALKRILHASYDDIFAGLEPVSRYQEEE